MVHVPTIRVRRKADGADCIVNVTDYEENRKLYAEWKDEDEQPEMKTKKIAKPKE